MDSGWIDIVVLGFRGVAFGTRAVAWGRIVLRGDAIQTTGPFQQLPPQLLHGYDVWPNAT